MRRRSHPASDAVVVFQPSSPLVGHLRPRPNRRRSQSRSPSRSPSLSRWPRHQHPLHHQPHLHHPRLHPTRVSLSMTKADVPAGTAASDRGSEGPVAGYRVEGLLRRIAEDDAVYAATDLAQGRSVELRLVTAGDDGDLHARFESFVVRPSSIVHPHLPVVYESGEASEGMFLASARLEGVTLSELAGNGGLPPMRAVRLLGRVADALDAVHRQGLAHGDLRVERVVVVERHVEHPYLVDFGLPDGEASGAEEKTASADVRAFAAVLYTCLAGVPPSTGPAGKPRRLDELREDTPEALGRLLADAMSGTGQAARYSAGELINQVARYVFSAPRPGRAARPQPQPAQRASEPPPAWISQPRPVWPPSRPRGPREWLLGGRIPAAAAILAVAAAALIGLLVGRLSEDEGGVSALTSEGGFSVGLPDGWEEAPGGPGIPGLDLAGPLSAGPEGRPALVAGRLRGVEGSVYPEAVARRVDPDPPPPTPVALTRHEALRVRGVDAGPAGRITLFVVPTALGTLAAACLRSAPPECEQVAASMELPDAAPSRLAGVTSFARRLDRVLERLDARRSVASLRLRSAALAREQAGAATDLARAYREARVSLARGAGAQEPLAARRRVASSLARAAASYRRLARAAARRRQAQFARAARAARGSEAQLQALLRRL
jgi:hypothetical protein